MGQGADAEYTWGIIIWTVIGCIAVSIVACVMCCYLRWCQRAQADQSALAANEAVVVAVAAIPYGGSGAVDPATAQHYHVQPSYAPQPGVVVYAPPVGYAPPPTQL
jgi:hypothetical protein